MPAKVQEKKKLEGEETGEKASTRKSIKSRLGLRGSTEEGNGLKETDGKNHREKRTPPGKKSRIRCPGRSNQHPKRGAQMENQKKNSPTVSETWSIKCKTSKKKRGNVNPNDPCAKKNEQGGNTVEEQHPT